MSYLALSVPRTGLEPARLAALAPETSASTIPPPGLLWVQRYYGFAICASVWGLFCRAALEFFLFGYGDEAQPGQ